MVSPDPEDLGGRRVRRRPIPRQRPRGVSVPWPISPQLDDVPVDQRVVNGTGGARVPAVRPVAGPYLALGAEAHALYIAGRSDEAGSSLASFRGAAVIDSTAPERALCRPAWVGEEGRQGRPLPRHRPLRPCGAPEGPL